jgi:hypothetical protein
MIHRGSKVLTLDTLKEIIKKMKRLVEMLGGKMKKLLTVAVLLIASTNANAAFYLITNEGNKVTVSNDLSIAVYINPKTERRGLLGI